MDPRGVTPGSPNPLVGHRFYVDPLEQSYKSWRWLQRKGKTRSANILWRLAREPKFRWLGRFTYDVTKTVHAYTDRAYAAGSLPMMAILRHQGKQCHSRYKAGGRAEDARTRKWYRKFAAAVGSRRVVIAYEPDSIGTIKCLAKSRRDDRIRLLRYGVDVLSKLPNATIYLEAGSSDWEGAAITARKLKRIGIHKVRGFMLNVTHYDWTAASTKFGLDVSRRVGGKPFIINTARNGRGPVHYRKWVGKRLRTFNVVCHPRFRGIGPPPTTKTMHRKVDAYMYINRAGHSSGSCNGGPLPIGSWWPKHALSLARYATNWVRAPRRTRFGHRRGRVSVKMAAGDQIRYR